MKPSLCIAVVSTAATLLTIAGPQQAFAGRLTVELRNSSAVTFVGALNRWDLDGNHRVPVDTKAKIDQPRVDAAAKRVADEKWVFENLSAGRYDLVIFADNRTRIEGFHYPPVLEFDPFMMHDQKPADEDVELITKQIVNSNTTKIR